MAQIFNIETDIGDLTKASATSVQLAASTIPVGGKQYSFSSLVCDLTTNGAGGLDTGSLVNSTFYYVYVVVASGVPQLIASTSVSKPTGYNTRYKVGAFYTDLSSEVNRVFYYRETNIYTNKIIVDATGSGGFTGGTLSVVREGNTISISSLTDLTFSSGTLITSADGLIPEWARPFSLTSNVFISLSSGVFNVDVNELGVFRIFTRDWSGSGLNVISASAISSTYNAGDLLDPIDWKQYRD